jgi:hypothetical protein
MLDYEIYEDEYFAQEMLEVEDLLPAPTEG